jgi:hypothetical protein
MEQMMRNTVNLEENLVVADLGDTKVDDLEILEFFQVGPAADIPALRNIVRGIVPLLIKMQKPKPSLKIKAT